MKRKRIVIEDESILDADSLPVTDYDSNTKTLISDYLYDDIIPLKGPDGEVKEVSIRDIDRIPSKGVWRAENIRNFYCRMISDLGGPSAITALEDELVKRASVLAVIGMEEDALMVLSGVKKSSEFDFEKYMTLTRTQAQLYKMLEIDRRKILSGEKDTADNLVSYLEKKKDYKRKKEWKKSL